MFCDLCGAETNRRLYYPTLVARVTHRIKHGLWICPACAELNRYMEFYRQQGFSFFPLKPRSKRPNIPRWEPYQHRRPTAEEVNGWVRDRLFGGIAVVCGSVSSNLTVLEFDSREAYLRAFPRSEELQKETFVVETSRGFHVYVKSVEPPGRTEKHESIKFEYRAEGGYVVAPPSTHPSGKKYVNVGSLKVMEATDIQHVKDRILLLLGGRVNADLRVRPSLGVLTRDYPCWTKLSRGVFEGDRDEAAFLLALHLRDKGLSKDVVKTVLSEWWKRLEQPPEAEQPFTRRELEKKVDQAFSRRYPAGCATIKKRWPSLCNEDCPLRVRKEVLERLKYGYKVVVRAK